MEAILRAMGEMVQTDSAHTWDQRMIDLRKPDLLFPEKRIKPGFKNNRNPTRDQIQIAIKRFQESGGTITKIEEKTSKKPNPRAMGLEWDQTLEDLEI